MRPSVIWKIIVTVVTIFYGLVPSIADWNETHLFHEGWSAHARLHGAWFLFFGASMSGISLFLIWVRNELLLPIVIGLSFVASFWLAFLTSPIYDGALVDPGGVEQTILGIESNVFVFSVTTLVFLAALIAQMRKRSS